MAYSSLGWKEAMQKELADLDANNTWTVTDLPQGKKPISSKWVYKVKYKAVGTLIDRYKARLVIKGCTKREGIDYT